MRPLERGPDAGDFAAPAFRLSAVYPAAGGLHDPGRADQRGGLAEIRKADQGRQVRRSRERGAPAGGEWRQRDRHLHGRGHDRRSARDDELPATAGNRAASGQGAVHGRLQQVGGD